MWSIWNYLRIVGCDPERGWLIDGPRIMTLILPLDMLAAIVAVADLVAAWRAD